jgi:hypothetical protein
MIPLQKPMVTAWLLSRQLPSGAILYSDTKINPYFGHIAAIGLVHVREFAAAIRWSEWCFQHWNWPDKYGIHGTMYDWEMQGNDWIGTGAMDSVDSYAALWLLLLQSLWDSADPTARAYVMAKSYEIDTLGGVIVQVMDKADGLTWAKPDYHIKYLMDNCESCAGLRACAYLFQRAIGDLEKTAYWNVMASKSFAGISYLRMGDKGNKLAVNQDESGKRQVPNMNTWYPDLLSQFYPLYYDLQLSYSLDLACNINSAPQDWSQLLPASRFPAVLSAVAMQHMGDWERLDRYLTQLHSRDYFKRQVWPWYCAEAGWYLML